MGTLIVLSRFNSAFCSSNYSFGNSFSIFFLTIGISRILSQLGLICGATYTKYLMVYARSLEKIFGIFGYMPLNTFLYSPCMSSARKGGFKVTDS